MKKKTSVFPTLKLKHLGMLIDSSFLMYFSPLERLVEIVNLIYVILKLSSVEARKLASLLGKIISWEYM